MTDKILVPNGVHYRGGSLCCFSWNHSTYGRRQNKEYNQHKVSNGLVVVVQWSVH